MIAFKIGPGYDFVALYTTEIKPRIAKVRIKKVICILFKQVTDNESKSYE
jgi:hypothetical protein